MGADEVLNGEFKRFVGPVGECVILLLGFLDGGRFF